MQTVRHSPWAWAPCALTLFLLALIHVTASNHDIFLGLNHAGLALLGPQWWINLTILGDGAVALALVVPCIRQSPQRFWAAIIAALLTTLWVQVLKHAVDVPRPLAVLAPDRFFHTGPGYRAVSFPSGHAAAIFAIAGIWIMSLPGRPLLRVLLLALAVLVSLSRIMVGVHWPVDLLGGMLGGWLSAWIGLLAARHWAWKTDGIAGYLAGTALLVVAAALLVSDHIGYPSALPFQRLLGTVCLGWGAVEMARMLPRRTPHASTNQERE